MSKLKAPFISLKATGKLGDISFKKSRKVNIAEKTPVPRDAKSAPQLSWRHMYQKCAALWHTLSAAEKDEWESLARPKHMTGFAYWQSQCLRPNPGIYLPLQGGTMSGNIDMDKNRILKLPLAADDQEPITLAYTKAYIFPFLYTEGARVYHNANQAIPNNTITPLAFNSERYDTDSIHDPAVNNSRLTCKTAGKYVISAHCYFAANAVGGRRLQIYWNGTLYIFVTRRAPDDGNYGFLAATTMTHLSVNDFVEAAVLQDSGAPLNVVSAISFSPEFMMQRIGI